jgi:hypothetical protein
MRNWVDSGPPSVFNLPYFFFPQAFLTGTLQNFARSRHIPIDLIAFHHIVIEEPPEKLPNPPANGEVEFVIIIVYIKKYFFLGLLHMRFVCRRCSLGFYNPYHR